jgi:hypothetical protein
LSSPPDRSNAPSAIGRPAVDRILLQLKDRVRNRSQQLASRGPEDPAWVLLEVFAEELAALGEEADLLESRLFSRVLESLGDEPRWAHAATAPIAFLPQDGLDAAVSVPRGTIVSARRRDGDARVSFETLDEAWFGPAKLVRALTCAGDDCTEILPYPQTGWDGAPVPLFGRRDTIARHLYLGDSALLEARDRAVTLTLEWPGCPQAVWSGAWEYSTSGGWRALQVELEETAAGSRRSVLLRLRGPLPDLSEATVESANLPWIRVSLEGEKRILLAPPRWVAVSPARPLQFPRPVARILSRGGERFEDHSLTAQKVAPLESPEAWDPAVYLGWDRPTPASVYWAIQGRPAPAGWGGVAGQRRPVLVWEHSTGRGFRQLEVADGTRGFSRSGQLIWNLPAEWTPQERFGERLHWVRARWVSGAYFEAPRVRALLPHAVEARQQRTLLGTVLEVTLDRSGRGRIPLPSRDEEPERFTAMEVRSSTGEWQRLASVGAIDAEPSSVEPPSEPGGTAAPAPERFRAVRAADGYELDLGPRWSGATSIRWPVLSLTLGARGNVPASTLTVVEAEVHGLRRLAQPLDADGGRDPESPDLFRQRIRAEWRAGARAVTSEDYRRLALALDASLARVEAFAAPAEPGRVIVCILPAEPCTPGRISPARLEWLAEMLERKSPLGTVVTVVEPMYLPVEIVVRLADAEGAFRASELDALRVQGQDALRRYLHPIWGGPERRGFPLGRWLNDTEVTSIMSPVLGGLGPAAGAGARSLAVEFRTWPGGAPISNSENLRLDSAPTALPVLEKLTIAIQERR